MTPASEPVRNVSRMLRYLYYLVKPSWKKIPLDTANGIMIYAKSFPD